MAVELLQFFDMRQVSLGSFGLTFCKPSCISTIWWLVVLGRGSHPQRLYSMFMLVESCFPDNHMVIRASG
jgi:hypothetical protein